MSSRLDLQVKFNGPQFQAHRVIKPRTTVFCGWGRGVGKSHFTRQECYLQIAQHEFKQRQRCPKRLLGARVLGLMPTLKQFKDVHMDGLLAELGKGGQWDFLGAKINSNLGHVSFPGGSWIRPFPATAHNSKSARGQRGDVILGDEIDDVDPDVYHSVAIPWLSEPYSLALELLGGTPTRGRHGLWYQMLDTGRIAQRLRTGELSVEAALQADFAQDIIGVFANLEPQHRPLGLPEDPELAAIEVLKSFYSFHATYKDAPETVSPLAVARAKRNTPKDTFEREWLANPDAGEGIIFPEFDESFHVRPAPPLEHFDEFLIGVDHGDVHPGVALLIGVKGHDEHASAHVVKEYCESGCLNKVWDERLAEWRFGTIYADPSRKDRIRDWRSHGLKVKDLPAEVKPVAAGLGRIANMLHRRQHDVFDDWARLYIDPACTQTIRGFGMYRRKKLPDGTFSEDPEKKNDDCMDALRYAIAGRFGRVSSSRVTVSGS